MQFTAFPHLAKFLPENEILFDQALLAEGSSWTRGAAGQGGQLDKGGSWTRGGQLDDPASFVSQLNQLLLELSH